MELEVGLRVVRGPDWESGDQDGGEGNVGTVVEVPGRSASGQQDDGDWQSDCRHVIVQWDYGKKFKYRCGVEQKYDLRVLDNAPVGIMHSGVICDSCGREDVLSGMRWKCAYCFDYDLCSSCYMAGKHNLEHHFTRFDKKRALMHYVPSRSGARRVEAKGIFEGAEVNRSTVDWEYGADDGGPGGVGKVLSCRNWHNEESYRSAVDVQWKSTEKCTLCRVGHKGKVDVKCVNSASGGFYYPDHLPVLGAAYKAPGPREFASGDYVKVELDEDAFSAALQSGNSLDTIMIIGEIGVIKSISNGRKVTVKFVQDQIKTIDVSVLVKANIPRLWSNQVVRVIDDMAEVMKLHVGHGQWCDGMENIPGKTGIVIGQSDRGDVAVRFEGRETDVLLNPHSLIIANDQSGTLKPGVGFQRDQGALQAKVQSLFEQDNSDVLFQAASLGDGTVIREFLCKFPNEVNKKFENGRTALHQAALQGYASVAKALLEYNADKDLSDLDGQTPLHLCAQRSNADVATVLLQDGANPNLADLEGRTPLVIAASKGKTSVVQVFVDEPKTDLNVQDKDKNTALHHAVLASWHWSVRLLLLAKADPAKMNSKDQAPLHIACGKGFTAAVEVILKHYPDQINLKNGTHKTPLYFASLNGRADIVTYLLSQQGCDVSIKCLEGHTPLHAAVVSGVPKSVEKLIGHGADVNARDNKGNTPLHMLRMMKKSEESDDLPELLKVKEMLNCYENVIPQTILACFLVYKGADIYIKNSSGTTALQELPIEVSAVVATFSEKNFKADTEDRCASDPCPSTNTCVSTSPPKSASAVDEAMKSPSAKNQSCLQCMLCEEPVTVKLLPCGHTQICVLCLERAKKCPQCKKRISEVKDID